MILGARASRAIWDATLPAGTLIRRLRQGEKLRAGPRQLLRSSSPIRLKRTLALGQLSAIHFQRVPDCRWRLAG